MTEDQQVLLDAIVTVLQHDAAIDAAWLTGSLGAGGGDRFSDVDVLVLTADAAAAVARYAADLSAIAPTVLVNVIYGRVVNAVTEDWRRFDLSFVQPAELGRYNAARLRPLFNRTGAEPPSTPVGGYRTRPQDLAALVKEFYRVLGLSVVCLGREEYVVCAMGVGLLRDMIVNLMLEENGVGPADRGGALKRNPFLSPEQRSELASLSPVVATREGILAANAEHAAIFLPRARRLAAEIGMDWPTALETATAAHLQRNLDFTIPG
jgi:predicted nucleotidyltransferase